jgi:hypothetical protein
MIAEFSSEHDGNKITVRFEGDQLSRNDQERLKSDIECFLRSLRPNKGNLADPMTE